MAGERVVIVGAGVGGLAAAALLAAHGLDVTVVERADGPGGKLRAARIDAAQLDAGPTVLTMRPVLEELFAAAGASLGAHLTLRPATILARHAWDAGGRLDLYADAARTTAAIGALAGAAEARRYQQFAARAAGVYATLARPFIHAPRPSALELVTRVGLRRVRELLAITPFETLWSALGREFTDPRLRQLFARYATYCGSSPLLAPATLMLVADVEQQGVWYVEGGMHRIALALAAVAAAGGARLRYGTEAGEIEVRKGRVTGVRLAGAETLPADAVVANCDVAAFAAGLFGPAARRATPGTPRSGRSLSALTWNLVAKTAGFPLLRHTVFFSADYPAEFADLFRHRRLPRAPTVYVCAQDRHDDDVAGPDVPERLLCLVNAPPCGDTNRFDAAEIDPCEERTFGLLERCGLTIERQPAATLVTTPADFAQRYPATGGALYGRASHGWHASFQRPGSRSRIAGLYLAGGSTHPGPGVPMAAVSGQLAAAAVLADFASTSKSRPAATRGGTSTRSATTGRTRSP